ncbi:MAG: hypothetical protein ACE5MG_12835 [Candidatus Methylomirabilales bacterium]
MWYLMDRGDNSCAGKKRYLRLCLLAAGIFLTGCAGGRIIEGAYNNEAKGFSVQLPSNGWSVEIGDEADLVLRHKYRQAGISIHATCGEIPPDRPLEVVSRHLFFGIRAKETLRQTQHTDGRWEGLEVVLRGELGGQELLLHGYTLKDPDCVYDLVLFALPNEYPEVNRDFEALVRRFHLLPGETP